MSSLEEMTAVTEVDFLGERHRLTADDQLTFGRAADLVIDDNPFMHREVGRIRCIAASPDSSQSASTWILENLGDRIELVIIDPARGTRATVPPGQRASLPVGEWRIAFTAGAGVYELSGASDAPAAAVIQPRPVAGQPTAQFAWVELTDSQRLVLVALCQEYLRGDLHPAIPPDKAVAAQLGLTTKAVQRKVDNLANKFSAAGVTGLKPEAGAGDRRRERLVAHALGSKMVGVDDLANLE